jgi:hypothetical protein
MEAWGTFFIIVGTTWQTLAAVGEFKVQVARITHLIPRWRFTELYILMHATEFTDCDRNLAGAFLTNEIGWMILLVGSLALFLGTRI